MAWDGEIYLTAATTAAELLAHQAVAAAWREPSALPKMTVQGLAGHLAGQNFFIPTVLADPEPAEPVISIHEHYARMRACGGGRHLRQADHGGVERSLLAKALTRRPFP